VNFFKKIASISISIFFIYLCLKDIPLNTLLIDVDYNLNILIIAILILFLINIIKSIRLKILLQNFKKKNFSFYFKPVLLRQFLNTVFFFNIGELLTPLVLKRYFKCSYFEGLSILFSERLIDLTVITLIFGVSLIFNDFNLGNEIIYIYFAIYFFLIFSFLYIVKFKKKIFLIPKKIIQKVISGYNLSIKNKNILWLSFLFSFTIWIVFIFIDLLIFKSFEITSPIATIPNIIFLTGVMVFSQFIPAAPASVGIFNFFIIQTIEAFYIAQGISYDLSTKIELTGISIIVLVMYVIPDITWGGYVFYKETLVSLKKIR
jgi:uncharacterized membrane protein YbhN (UPF0104 family)